MSCKKECFGRKPSVPSVHGAKNKALCRSKSPNSAV